MRLACLSSKLLLIYFCLIPINAQSAINDYFPQDLGPSSSNYGEVGLLEMPTARLMEEGSLKFGISSSYPNEYTYIVATPFSWLETTYRYSELKDQKYGPFSYSGNQSLKDKGFDVKIKLLNETFYLPQLAIGIRDLAGTGIFAGEYLVGSKEIGNFDVSLGLGWGTLGEAGNIKNPFLDIHDGFRSRNSSTGQGGSFNFKNLFSGERASVYGGIEYYLFRHGLTFKLEYDTTHNGNTFRSTHPVKSRYNFGITKPLGKWVDLGLSYERGSEFRVSFSFKGNYGRGSLVPKIDSPKNVVPLSREQKNNILKNKQIFYRSINKNLGEENIYIQGASLNKKSAEIVIAQNRFRSYPRAVGRTARIVSALSPDEIDKLQIVVMNGDIGVSSFSISRDEFDSSINNLSSPNELLTKTELKTIGDDTPSILTTDFKPIVNFPEFFWNMSPALRHQIGGPEAFYLGQLWWKIDTSIKFKRNLTLHTTLGFDIYNTFNEFANPSYSDIPHVRSDIQEYLLEGKNNIARMKIDYLWSPGKDLFARIDLGYLEEMFGGFGGEIYYRPFNKQFSTSLSLHHVKQRSYDQRFGFKDYSTETGHLGLYYDFPNQIQSQFLFGKYLAGDIGATIDLSRRFHNGFTLGVFATKTNLSAEEFGEGSFDKGFYFSIPVDLFYTNYQTGDISFGMHPLTKDGGAMLNHHNSLYALFGDTNKSTILRDWNDILD